MPRRCARRVASGCPWDGSRPGAMSRCRTSRNYRDHRRVRRSSPSPHSRSRSPSPSPRWRVELGQAEIARGIPPTARPSGTGKRRHAILIQQCLNTRNWRVTAVRDGHLGMAGHRARRLSTSDATPTPPRRPITGIDRQPYSVAGTLQPDAEYSTGLRAASPLAARRNEGRRVAHQMISSRRQHVLGSRLWHERRAPGAIGQIAPHRLQRRIGLEPDRRAVQHMKR